MLNNNTYMTKKV